MKTMTILLPDAVSQMLFAEANRQNVDAVALCSGLVVEHFLQHRRETPRPSISEHLDPQTLGPQHSGALKFDVLKHFPDYQGLSIRLAQLFVDEALSVPGTRAFVSFSGRGVGIEPNFVFVEYLIKKQSPGGIGVSFYGSPDKLGNAALKPGRNPNYSRAVTNTQEDLKPLLQLIRRSYELKFGRTP